MEKIITLELSQRDGYKPTNSPANWITTIKEPIIINEGDIIEMKQALINTQNASSGNLVFDEDQELSITFGYYVTIPNKKFEQNGYELSKMIKRSENVNEYAQPGVATIDDGNYTTLQKDNPDKVKYYVLRNRKGNHSYEIYEPGNIHTYTWNYTLTAGSYNPLQIADIITDELSKDENLLIDGILNTGNQHNKSLFALNLTDLYQLKGLNAFPDPNYFVPLQINMVEYKNYDPTIGASQSQFKWDNGSFKWDIIHTPRFDSGGNGLFPITVLSWYKGKPITKYTQYSGLFITAISPGSFWDKLGFTDAFNMEHIYPYDSNGKSINDTTSNFTAERFERYITGEFFGNQSRLYSKSDNAVFINKSLNDGLVLLQSSAKQSLKSGGSYQSDVDGFFLVEIQSGYENDYFDLDSRHKYINAVISKNYNSFDFVTAYGGQSGMTYIHKGESQSLSSFNVRILNPDKSEVQSLGENSTIFLQIIKQEAQEEKQKKSK